MFLNKYEYQQIMNEIPDFELSYESTSHKKVHKHDFLFAIPEGTKYLVWFTTLHAQNICVFAELNSHNKISKINTRYAVCFDNKLSYGTLLYGTLFEYDSKVFFTSEDIIYYKGENVYSQSLIERLNILEIMYKNEIRQVSYFKNNVIMGLPIIHTNYQEFINIIRIIPYTIKYIQFRFLQREKNYDVVNMKYIKTDNYSTYNHANNTHSQSKELIFKVKADIQNDIYNLYYYDNNSSDNFHSIASIPDYKTSVYMNKLFRNIKENDNLDALEESDDEEEFEDDRVDKYVYLDRSYKMLCIYNYKHKKWQPLHVVNNKERIVTKKHLY